MEHKPAFHLALLQIIHVLLVHLRAERAGNDGLCLTASKESGTVNSGKPPYLARDRPDLGELAAVGSSTFAKNVLAKDILFKKRKCLRGLLPCQRIILGVAFNHFLLQLIDGSISR